MSARYLRKVLKEQEQNQFQNDSDVIHDEEEEDEELDQTESGGHLKNPFDLLNDDDDDQDMEQVEAEYLFEAKTVQKMELLVLSTLEWKMNPVTPYTFLDYMTRRLGVKDHLCLEFLGRCKIVLLATVSDYRFMCYLPSVVAAAIMLHVISSVDPCIVEEYQTQILAILGMNKVEKMGQIKRVEYIFTKLIRIISVALPGTMCF